MIRQRLSNVEKPCHTQSEIILMIKTEEGNRLEAREWKNQESQLHSKVTPLGRN